MPSRIYCATGTIGGATGALDTIDGADLSDKDMAIVMDQTNVRFYVLDDDASGVEDSTNYTVINPDTNPGTKSWILQSIAVNDVSYVQDDLVVTDAAEIKGSLQVGDADGTGANLTIYSDTAGDTVVFDKTAKTATFTDYQIVANNTDINGGNIDGTAIGAATPAAGTFTTCDATTDFTVGGLVITDNTITDDGTLVINATTATSFSDGNITNVGDIALDSISSDGAASSLTITATAGQAVAVEGVDFDGGTIGAFTAAGAINFGNQAMTNVDINSGAIDGTAIGAASASTIVGTTIDASTDFTVGGTVITSGDIQDDGALSIDAATSVIIEGGVLNVGQEDNSEYGQVRLYAREAAQTQGGSITIDTAADHDAAIANYQIQVTSDDLTIGPDTDTDAIKWDGTSGFLHLTNGDVRIGTEDASQGNVRLFSGTADTVGGKLTIDTNPTHDTTIANFQIQASSDDLYIGPSTNTDSLKYDGASNTWTFTEDATFAGVNIDDLGAVATADINGGSIDGTTIGAASTSTIVGTTIDAETDFTVGGTVITDATITDDGELLLNGVTGVNCQFNGTTVWEVDEGIARLYNSAGTLSGYFTHQGTNNFNMINETNTGKIVLYGTNSGLKAMLELDPAGAATLYNAGTARAKTDATGILTNTVTALSTDTDLTLAANGTGVIDINDSWNAASQTCSDLGAVTTCDINGGTIDGTTIGSNSMGDAAQLSWDAAPASDHTAAGDTIEATVDQNTTGQFGCLVMSSDGNWDDADKDSEALVKGPIALAVDTGTGASKTLLLRGFARDDTWNWTPGVPLYVQDSGAITNDISGYTTGDFIKCIGHAWTADIVYFNPSPDYAEVTA